MPIAFRTAGRKDYLLSLGVSEDVANWIDSQPEYAAGSLVSQLRTNPALTIEQLNSMAPKTPQVFVSELASRYPEGPFKTWVTVQDRKFRTAKVPLELLSAQLPLIYDWYQWEVQNSGVDAQNNPRFNLASFNFEQAVAGQEEWHAVMAGKGSGTRYAPTHPDSISHEYRHEILKPGWTMQEVTSENDLLCEGNLMSHCVGSYAEQVANGQWQIFSLRDENNNPQATIRMNPENWQLMEVQAFSNREPAQEIKNMVKEWLQWTTNSYPRPEDPRRVLKDIPISDVAYALKEAYDIDPMTKEYDHAIDLSQIDISDVYDEVIDIVNKNYSENPYRWHNNADHHYDEISRNLASITVNHDKEVIKNILNSKASGISRWVQYYNANGQRILENKISELEDRIQKELDQAIEEEFPQETEPELDSYLPDLHAYDDDEDYESDYRNGVQQYEYAHAQWKDSEERAREKFEKSKRDELEDSGEVNFIKFLTENLKSFISWDAELKELKTQLYRKDEVPAQVN